MALPFAAAPNLVGFAQQNAMLDFSPVTDAMASWRRQQQQDVENKRAERSMAINEGQFNLQKDRYSDEKERRLKEAAGNLALLYDPKSDPSGEKWKSFISTHPNAAGLDAKYHAPDTGRLAVLADAGMGQQYLDWQLRKASEGRAAAADGRAAAMHVPQLETARVQAEAARRDFNTPKVNSADLGADHARVFYDRNGQETGRIEGPKKGIDKDVASIEHQLRGEVSGLAKDYRTIRDASANVESLVKSPSAASDIALIFQYMKILDPQSVVREGEFATAQNAAGVGDRMVNIYNRILSGERLNDSQRMDFAKQAATLAGTKLNQYRRDIDQYRAVAERSKVNPANVILDQELLSPQGRIDPGNSGQGLPIVSPQDASRLPPGTMFRTQDGRTMRVPQR